MLPLEMLHPRKTGFYIPKRKSSSSNHYRLFFANVTVQQLPTLGSETPMQRRRARSTLQKAHSLGHLALFNSSGKENLGFSDGHLADVVPATKFYATKDELADAQKHSKDYEQCSCNSQHQVGCAQALQEHALQQSSAKPVRSRAFYGELHSVHRAIDNYRMICCL